MPAEKTNPFESPATRNELGAEPDSRLPRRPTVWAQIVGSVAAAFAFIGGFLIVALAIGRLLPVVGGTWALSIGMVAGVVAAWYARYAVERSLSS